MVIQFSIDDMEKIRDLVLTYPPDMDLKHFFVVIDSWIKSNKNMYHIDKNAKKIIDTFEQKNDNWYPIIKKSEYINGLFSRLEYLCVQDQNC